MAEEALHTEVLLKYLECTICYTVCKGNIFQCSNEHDICEECFSQLHRKRCPTCNVIYSERPKRSRRVERMIAALNLGDECPNAEEGCTFKAKGAR